MEAAEAVLLVVEARKRSGTYITVTQALEQGKEVYVVPGRITDALSEGCNFLLSQGAGVAAGPESIAEELEIEPGDILLKINDEVMLTNLRQKDAVKDALDSLLMVKRSLEDNMPEDFLSIDLMGAYSSLGYVIGEEIGDLFQDKRGEVSQFLLVIISGIAVHHSNQLIIQLSSVNHVQITQYAGGDDTTGEGRIGADHQNIQRVAIGGEGMLNNTVLGRVDHGGIQHTVQLDAAGFFIQFVFVFGAFFNFNYSDKIIRCNPFWVYIVPDV